MAVRRLTSDLKKRGPTKLNFAAAVFCQRREKGGEGPDEIKMGHRVKKIEMLTSDVASGVVSSQLKGLAAMLLKTLSSKALYGRSLVS